MHFDFLAAGLPFRRHICDSISKAVCVDLKSPSMNDIQCDVSCLSVSELMCNAAVQTYADVYLSSQLVVGKDQPKE